MSKSKGKAPSKGKMSKNQGPKARYWSATWHIPKDKSESWAMTYQEDIQVWIKMIGNKFVFQLEDSHIGKSDEELIEKYAEFKKEVPPHGLHFQIQFHSESQLRKTYLINYAKDQVWKNMNFRMCSTAGIKALQKYCMKQESRVAGPWADQKIYMGRDIININNLYPVQKEMLQYCLECDPIEEEDRLFIWVYCKGGRSGKSAFQKFCQWHYGWPGFTVAKAADILHIAQKYQMQKVYMFNLSKSRRPQDESELFEAIEALKDGKYASGKYDGDIVMQDPSLVLVFANEMPNPDAMTDERMEIHVWQALPNAARKRRKKKYFSGKYSKILNLAQAKKMYAEQELNKMVGPSDKKEYTSLIAYKKDKAEKGEAA